MKLYFTKMHGLGNDFIVLDATRVPLNLTSQQINYLADRHFGVGCDQVLLLEAPRNNAQDFFYRIFNADGQEVEQCGNGARCIAKFIHLKKLSDKRDLVVGTNTGKLTLQLQNDGTVTVDMGVPTFVPAQIPFNAQDKFIEQDFKVLDQTVKLSAVGLGNPHAVIRVHDVENAPVALLGPAIEAHERFPRRVNVGFMQVVNSEQLKLRVFERGVGETFACGSGACAAAVVACTLGLVKSPVWVELPGGNLNINWKGEGHPVLMTGDANLVYEGLIELS